MSPTTILVLAVVVLGSLLLPLLIYVALRRRMRPGQLPPSTQAMVAEARYDPGERPATLAAEQIEEVVKRKLEAYPDLADLKIDFGSMPDLTIDIWVGEQQYDDVADIPDQRIRQAIQQAADEFNA